MNISREESLRKNAFVTGHNHAMRDKFSNDITTSEEALEVAVGQEIDELFGEITPKEMGIYWLWYYKGRHYANTGKLPRGWSKDVIEKWLEEFHRKGMSGRRLRDARGRFVSRKKGKGLGLNYTAASRPRARGVKIWVQAFLQGEYNAATGMYYWLVTLKRKKQRGAQQRKPQSFGSSFSRHDFTSQTAAREAAAEDLRGKYITGRVEGIVPGQRAPDRLWLLFEVYAERSPRKDKYRYVTVALPPENHRTKPTAVCEPSLPYYESAADAVSEGLSWLRNNFTTGRFIPD